MQYPQLSQNALEHFEKKLPFVLYSLPDSNSITGIFQNNLAINSSSNLLKDSFVLAPFDLQEELLQIPFADSEVITCEEIPEFPLNEIETTINESPLDKETHLHLVQKAIENITKGGIQKIVVSRKKELSLKEFDLKKLCDSLFSQNPTAFRYIWYHPKTNIWCGATPEVLLKTQGSVFSTMALAGTQKLNGQSIIFWEQKEKSEQQWVVDAIVDNLINKTTALNISKTETQIAGNLAHLRTDIKGVLNTSKYALKNVVETLHPTPAVCGTPKEKAQAFIYRNEGYDREFYTGFLGVANSQKDETELFVNLRCIKIEGNKATLFAGGGITQDSQPEAEWEETHNKLQTMTKVLQPLL